MMTFHLLNLNQQLTTLLIASIIFKQIIVNSFKNIYQIYAYIYKSLEPGVTTYVIAWVL